MKQVPVENVCRVLLIKLTENPLSLPLIIPLHRHLQSTPFSAKYNTCTDKCCLACGRWSDFTYGILNKMFVFYFLLGREKLQFITHGEWTSFSDCDKTSLIKLLIKASDLNCAPLLVKIWMIDNLIVAFFCFYFIYYILKNFVPELF